MKNTTTLRDAELTIADARRAGFPVEVDDCRQHGFTLYSIDLPRNPYSDASGQVLVTVRESRKGGRASASIRTIRPGADTRGPWDARWAIRQHAADAYSWARAMAARTGALDSAAL